MQQADLYRKYFEHQCVNHPDLAHASTAGSRVFEMVSVEEALGDFRSGAKEKGFIFRLLQYTYTVGDDGVHEVKKAMQGGFVIARYFSGRILGTADYYEAMEDAERVIDEMIEKMLADSRAGHPLWYYSLDARQDIIVQPVTVLGDASYTGWLCTFRWSNFFRNCLSDPAAPVWLDEGATPFEL